MVASDFVIHGLRLRTRLGHGICLLTPRPYRHNKAGKAAPPAYPKHSSNENDSTRANVQEQPSAPSPTRPSSAPEQIPGRGKKMDDFENLTLGYEPPAEGQQRPTSANNPLKRVAEGEFDLGGAEQPIGGQQLGSMNTRPCHGKHTSGRLSGSHNLGLNRRDPPVGDQEYVRTIPDRNQRLWVPEIDATGKGIRRTEDHVAADQGPPFQPLKDQPTLRRSELVQRQDWSAHQKFEYDTPRPPKLVHSSPLMHQTNTSYNDKGRPPRRSEEDRNSQKEDSPPQDQPPEGQEAEPEMLLQPETRPVSHEQLVWEVKGTISLNGTWLRLRLY